MNEHSGSGTIQRSCECAISGGIQSHVGWDPEQPDLVVGNSDPGRGLELDDL